MCLSVLNEAEITYCKPEIIIEPVIHKREKRLKLLFRYDLALIQIIRNIDGRKWSETMHCWHIPYSEDYIKKINLRLGAKYSIKYPEDDYLIEVLKIKPKIPNYTKIKIDLFIQYLKNQRYSENTIENYVSAIKTFFEYINNKEPEAIELTDLFNFNEECIIKEKKSISYQNIFISAIKLFFHVVYHKQFELNEIKRPRNEYRLPQIFSKEDVERILLSPKNIKHRAMLSTIYACGLRCGDLINLKIEDLDTDRKLIHIKKGKGKKDRIVPIPENLIKLLRDYYKIYKPKVYLFEGIKSGERYCETSLRQVFKSALNKTGINSQAKLHWLRHSFATHLLENGTDIRFIQEILGHKSTKTTEIYTHVSTRSIQNIKNPFENLQI